MRRDDVRFAVAAREDGLRRVRSLTVRVGAAGVVSSAAIALALGHPAGPAIHSTTGSDARPSQTGPSGSRSSASPGSSAQGSSPPGSSQPSSAPQAPVQNPVPAAGSGQAVSGGS
jgi:hypothetical protein